jgi:hypothetical protein
MMLSRFPLEIRIFRVQIAVKCFDVGLAADLKTKVRFFERSGCLNGCVSTMANGSMRPVPVPPPLSHE